MNNRISIIPINGAIPESWEFVQLRELFKERLTKVSDRDYPPLSVGKMGVVPQLETAVKTEHGDNRKLVKEGDFAINSRSDRKGAGGISSYSGSVSLIINVLKPIRVIDKSYFNYLLTSNDFKERYYQLGHGLVSDLWTTKWDEMKGISVPFPPLYEQKQITEYLDWKTSEINQLINGYQKQIRLLDEYELALIDSCVANGIRNSQKKRVQSNWVSEIPCNWSFDKVKQHFEIRKRIAGKEGYDVISITQQGLKVKNLSSNEGQMALDYSKYQFVYPHEFAMNHMDLLTGYIGLSEVFGVTSPDYRVFAALSPDKLNLKYFLYVFQLGYKRKIFYGLGRGAANKGRWRLPAQNFLNYEIPIPPKEEQDEIVEFLDKKLTLTAQAKTSFEKRVNLLKEYKTALISNVVTGQVDVRDIAIPEYEAVELTDTGSDIEAEAEG